MRKFFICLMTVVLLVATLVPISVSAADTRLTIEAQQITTAPTLDGVVTEEEWGKPFFSGDPRKATDLFVVTKDLADSVYPTDVKIWMRWDEKNLYVAATVKEDVFWNGNTKANCWIGDGIQFDICIDDKTQGVRWRTNTAMSTIDGATYAYINNKPNDKLDGLTGAGDKERSADPNGAGAAKVLEKDGLVTYEISFPWAWYGNGATIEVGHQLLVNPQFYMADGSMAPEGTSFPGTAYLGSFRYGNLDAEGNSLYPLVKLVAAAPETPEAPETTEAPTTTTPSAPTQAPATGDATLISVAMAAAAMAGVVIVAKKRAK